MTEVFIDSSVLFLFAGPSSTQRKYIHDYLLQEHPPLITTNIVVAETLSLITKRINKHTGIQFLEIIEKSQILKIIYANETLTQTALRLYRKYTDKDFDLIDATSFVLCKERKIKQVLTLDKHFSQMGFEMLPSHR